MSTNALRWYIVALAVFFSGSVARADIVITAGPGNFPNDENVLFNAPGLIGTGTTVQGITNQSGFIVDFTSPTVLTTPAAGQARVEGSPTFTDLCVSLNAPGGTFTTLVFNLDVLNSAGDGSVNFTVNGAPYAGNPFPLDANGQNFFMAQAINGQSISEFCLDSSVALVEMRQIRIGGATVIPVPAAAWGGGALFLLMCARRIHRRRAS